MCQCENSGNNVFKGGMVPALSYSAQRVVIASTTVCFFCFVTAIAYVPDGVIGFCATLCS